MRYIFIKSDIDATNGAWINPNHIVTICDDTNREYTCIKLANGDNVFARHQDSIDIFSMLNLDISDSCGSKIADSPGTPARTGMHRTLTADGWDHWVEVTL